MPSNTTEISAVYGPVSSWRFGKSLGIDLLMDPSTCSFNCIYCQLGSIQRVTTERKIYVSTEKVMRDFKESKWQKADIITFSGSGEPTLAKNLGKIIEEIKKITKIKILILTNGTLLTNPEVRQDLLKADIVSVKLDAPDEKSFRQINRPAEGLSLDLILKGIKHLKKDIEASHSKPLLQIQIMFMPQSIDFTERTASLLNEIKPDEVALNTPTRPYPSGWDIITRGAHGEDAKKIKFSTKQLKTLSLEEAENIKERLNSLTGFKIISIYKD